MDDSSLLKIPDEPFDFRDTLREGIQYSRSQSSYRFKLLKMIRYFLKKPKMLLLSKCSIGFILISLPILVVIVLAYLNMLTFIPLITSETVSIVIILCLLLQKLYDDNKYKLNISPYWVRKAYYDMVHFLFVHSFVLWIVVSIYRFNSYLDELDIINDNSPQGRELKGCILIKLILILKYHDNTSSSKESLYVGSYSSLGLNDFFYEVHSKAQMVCVPILILSSILLGKAILVKVKFTLFYIGILLMVVLSCIAFQIDNYILYDTSNSQSYKERFNYFHLIPPILALISYGGLLGNIAHEGIQKKKIYDYGDKRPLYATKLAVQLLVMCSLLGCFCIIVAFICFLIIPITKDFSYIKVETVSLMILAGIGCIAFGSMFLIGNFILAMLLKPISKEYGRKKLTNQFCIHYTLKSNKKVKSIRKFLKLK